MTPQETEMIFAPLRSALLAQDYTLADIMQAAFGWTETGYSHIGMAMLKHVRDIDLEQRTAEPGDALHVEGWPNVMAEVYRRTFFDADKAALYGSDELIKAGGTHLKDLAQHLIDSLAMDEVMNEAQLSQVHEAPSSLN